jgi:hypothetical protein
MKEIKFRAWIHDDKDISDGYMDNHVFIWGDTEIWIDGDVCDIDECIEIMQYTGIEDINGNLIWESDIIKGILIDDDLLCMGEIIYDELMAFYGLKNDAGITPLFRLSNIEIIGNKFEDPELIK